MADYENQENPASADAQAGFEGAATENSTYNEGYSAEGGFDASADGERQGSKNPRDESAEEEPDAKKARHDGESASGDAGQAAMTEAAAYAQYTNENVALTDPAAQSASNLFVNGLPWDYSEDKLRSLFAPYGEIETIKVMWDHMTGRTKGYGFVKFRDYRDASKAVDALNGTKLGERNLLVKVADSGRTVPRPSMSGTPSPNVYISGLPETVDDSQLRQLFGPFGPIVDTKILIDLQTGVSRGQAFVRFEQQSSAEYAISALNNYMFPGAVRGILVRFADTQEEKAQRKAKQQQRGGDPRAAPGGGGGARGGYPGYDQYGGYGAAAYNAYAQAYGQYAGYPGYAAYAAYPGYSYAGYDAATAAAYGGGAEAAAAYGGGDWSAYGGGAPQQGGGGGQRDQPATTPQPGHEGHLFIYHLPPDADDALLYRLFGPYGSILSVKVMRDAVTNNCKGFGFVKFGDPAAAAAAVAALNGYQLGNKRLQVSFKK